MAEAQGSLRVCVVHCLGPRQVRESSLDLPAGATVADALQALGLVVALADDSRPPWSTGVWGRRVEPGHCLRDGDRVELYRPLLVDPKVARRERFARQGARGTGLFSRRRPGSKAGY